MLNHQIITIMNCFDADKSLLLLKCCGDEKKKHQICSILLIIKMLDQ